MVSTRYFVEKAKPPSSVKIIFNQVAMPVLIDTAGLVEQQIERLGFAVRRAPLRSVSTALALGLLIAALSPRTSRPPRS